MDAYVFKFAGATQLNKILSLYGKIGAELMICFLETSVVLTPGVGTNLYTNAIIEVPYENMADVGYVNSNLGLIGRTIRIRIEDLTVGTGSLTGTFEIWASVDEYETITNVRFIKEILQTNVFKVIQIFDALLYPPFYNTQDYELITTISNSWLSQTLKLIKKKTQWSFNWDEQSISFTFTDKILVYPTNADHSNERQVNVDTKVIDILKKIIAGNKSGVTKVRVKDGECWLVTGLGDWGQATIKIAKSM